MLYLCSVCSVVLANLLDDTLSVLSSRSSELSFVFYCLLSLSKSLPFTSSIVNSSSDLVSKAVISVL